MSETIEVGDRVAVNVHNGQFTVAHRAEVLYKPCATGDSWHFKCMDTGAIHYVSEGCTITKQAKP